MIFQAIPGTISLAGRRPDGDSVRFLADDPDRWRDLRRGRRVRLSGSGTVQLRLEGIDAPELHFGVAAQPYGADSRARLLDLLGFTSVTFGTTDPNEVTASTPADLRVSALTQDVDPNGRPIAYLVPNRTFGRTVTIDDALLRSTVNATMVSDGAAYPLLYSSCPGPHRDRFRALAATARRNRRGVWAIDRSPAFTLESPLAIGPAGQLIFPKLFRRCLAYLADVAHPGSLADWLRSQPASARPVNDPVRLPAGDWVTLADLIQQDGTTIRFTADLIGLTFAD